MKWSWDMICTRDKRGAYGVLVGSFEGPRPLGIPGSSLEDIMAIYVLRVAWRGTDWIDLDQDRDKRQALVNVLMNHGVP
jgi:hypothetical protein